MARLPATIRTLEGKMAHQEIELVALLKRIPLEVKEYRVIRQRTRALQEEQLKARGEALLPLTLAFFIFDALSGNISGMDIVIILEYCIVPGFGRVYFWALHKEEGTAHRTAAQIQS